MTPALTLDDKAPPTLARPGIAFIPYVRAVGRGAKLRRDLTEAEAATALDLILQRTATDAQIGAFLIGQRVKGEAADEIRGFTHAMRARFIRHIAPRVDNLLDLGLPYDGKSKTAQLGPAIAFTLATCGVPTLLHGAENIPAKAGITPGQVFQALGIAANETPAQVARRLERLGVAFYSVTQFSPEWEALTPLRWEFGLRTALNSVEKLFNPADAPFQVSGFFHGEYLERLRQAQTGTRASWMVQGEEGSIEMATGRPTHVYAEDEARDWVLAPATVGFGQRERLAVPPDLAAHAALNRAALAGQPGPALEQVVLTVGALLALLGAAPDFAAGVAQAQHALTSGAVQQRLEQSRG